MPQLNEWMTKAEAVKVLGVGDRQIDRRVKAGMIAVKREPRKPHEKTAPVLLRRADVLALKQGEPNYNPVAETVPLPLNPPGKAAAAAPLVMNQAAAVQRLFQLLAGPLALPAAAAASFPAAWVDLNEAAALSGLSVHFIRRRLLARLAERDSAINLRSKSHPVWRILRSDAANGFRVILSNGVSSAASTAAAGSLGA